ncbi:MAG: hypothetical protein IKR57_05600 [Bacilli bacterium]|nr:hypothetical protein [Bacilli bacterium]
MSKKSKRKQDNTMLWILIVILVVCFAAIGFLFYKYFYSGISTSKYGDTRLEGIENYPLSSTLSEDIASIYEKETSVGKVDVDVKGRIIWINIDFVKSVKVDTAKSLAVKALDKIGEENLKYYEVQYSLTYSGTDENSNFPIFGMKNVNSLKVVW